jgi:hypothetical protein
MFASYARRIRFDEPFSRLTDKFLLQPFQRKRATASIPHRLPGANVVRLWAGDVPTTWRGVFQPARDEAAPDSTREQYRRLAHMRSETG